MNLKTYLSKRAEDINNKIQQLLATWNLPTLLNDAIRHILESGGKRCRHSLAFLCCEALGGSTESVMPSAIAIEVIHNTSL